MYKKDLYTEVIRVLNLNTQSVTFKGGYLIAIYDSVPYVKEVSALNPFDYVNSEVVPVSEEISQETPSVNLADRSDYIFQYKIMFKSSKETEVLESLDEFRTYFFENKQVTIDGYVSSVKTSRGDKQGDILIQNGDFYSFYTIKLFVTALKSGYIWKDADSWQMRIKDEPVITAGSFVVDTSYKILTVGTTDFTLIGASANTIGVTFTATGVGTGTGTAIDLTYQTMVLSTETLAMAGNPNFSNATGVSLAVIDTLTIGGIMSLFYNGTLLDKKLYAWIMNTVDKDTQFELIHTLDSIEFPFTVVLTKGVRTRTDNGIVLMEIHWAEVE